jgi:hypothetical protein
VRLSEVEEIALARSAAPAAVSADATIWVLRNGFFEVAVRGVNSNHCFVQRSQPLSIEPICYDPEGAATIMRWEFEHFRARTEGLSRSEVENALAKAIRRGDIPLPKRATMSYMMSSGQRLYDPGSGRSVGNWMPHVMIYVPYLTAEMIGLGMNTDAISVAEEGTPMAHAIVVVPEFVDPQVP